MKNVILIGASRSGKSTVAKKISKELGMNHIPLDAIVSTLETLYPETGIKHEDDNIVMSKKLSTFIDEYLNHMDYEDIKYIIDLYQIYPKDLNKRLFDDHLVVYMGYPHIDPFKKLEDIKKHAREKDWTKYTPDEEMLNIIKLFIKENKIMYNQCKELNIPFFDVSSNFIEELDKVYEHIIKNV